MSEDTWDAGTYGRSFADVYDHWYADLGDVDAVVGLVRRLSAAAPDGGGRVLELGVGTGRLALPLAAAGLSVTGIDASPEMLEALEAKPGAGRVTAVLGDVADPGVYPAEPQAVVLAVFNLVCNLPDGDALARCIRAAAGCLAAGGALVVETFLARPVPERERRLEVKEVSAGRVVLIATDADPGTSLVTGSHIELVDGEPVRLRPWRVRWTGLEELDRLAADAGLEPAERWGAAPGEPFDPAGPSHLTVYRRPR